VRLAFLGTPDVALPPLRALVDAGHEIVQVVSRPDKRRGRGGALSESPVKEAARALGLAVSDQLSDVLGKGIELGVVVAYGRLIPPSVFEEVPMVNLHFSLLPRWRGAAPVERAILAGDPVTGVCVMEIAEGLDTGGVYAVEEVAIEPDESLEHLRARLGQVGARLLVHTLAEGLGVPTPQTGEPTYAAKIEPSELEIDWGRPAVEIARLVRLGRAWTTLDGKRLRILEAAVAPQGAGDPGTLEGLVVATGDGGLALRRVQPEGGRAMAASEWRRGVRADDAHLGS
jgi:methionyl-tRNA formyltransferase